MCCVPPDQPLSRPRHPQGLATLEDLPGAPAWGAGQGPARLVAGSVPPPAGGQGVRTVTHPAAPWFQPRPTRVLLRPLSRCTGSPRLREARLGPIPHRGPGVPGLPSKAGGLRGEERVCVGLARPGPGGRLQPRPAAAPSSASASNLPGEVTCGFSHSPVTPGQRWPRPQPEAARQSPGSPRGWPALRAWPAPHPMPEWGQPVRARGALGSLAGPLGRRLPPCPGAYPWPSWLLGLSRAGPGAGGGA